MEAFKQVHRLIQQGLQDGAYPCAALAVGIGRNIYRKDTYGNCTENTLFDMASVSKILCPTMIAFRFMEEGLLRLYDTVETFFPEREMNRLRFLRNNRKVKILTFILMTIPGTPKDLLSYFAGLTPLTLKQWMQIVAVSRIPSLLTSTISGAAAGEQNYLLSGVTLGLTAFMSIAGILYYRKLCREQGNE